MKKKKQSRILRQCAECGKNYVSPAHLGSPRCLLTQALVRQEAEGLEAVSGPHQWKSWLRGAGLRVEEDYVRMEIRQDTRGRWREEAVVGPYAPSWAVRLLRRVKELTPQTRRLLLFLLVRKEVGDRDMTLAALKSAYMIGGEKASEQLAQWMLKEENERRQQRKCETQTEDEGHGDRGDEEDEPEK